MTYDNQVRQDCWADWLSQNVTRGIDRQAMKDGQTHPYDVLLRIDAVCEPFEDLLNRGQQPRIEDFLDGWGGDERELLFRHLAEIEIEHFRQHDSDGNELPSNLAKRFPEYASAILAIDASECDRRSTSLPTTNTAARELPSQIGDYRIIREVGRGGMGVVYEAEQRSLRRRVALKILPLHVANDHLAMERFQHEAQLAAKLHHTNIVPVHEVGQDGDTCYYAMQFIDGLGLDHVRKTESTRDDGSELKTTSHADLDLPSLPTKSLTSGSGTSKRDSYYRCLAHLGEQAADALQYAHAHGVIHRDIKPANLLLDESGVVWITDFGLAKSEDVELTRTGDLLGTLRYVSPERLEGECDERADIYGLGATLYELLTLRPPFESSSRLELLRLIAEEEPPRPRSINARIPRDLETIVLKALRKIPEDRYATAGQLAEDLGRYVRDEPIVAQRLWPWERFGRWCKRNPIVATLTVAVACLLVATAAITFRAAVVQDRLATEAAVQQQSAEDRLIDVHTANGQRLLEQDRLAAALPWLAEAVRLDERRARQQGSADPTHRIRFATALRQCPKFAQAWINIRGINQARFSPDNSIVALACADNSVRLFHVVSGETVCGALMHEADVLCAAFSPDGRLLATGCGDGSLSLWKTDSGERIATTHPHQGGVVALSVSNDGTKVASASDDATACIWHLPSAQGGDSQSETSIDNAIRETSNLENAPAAQSDSTNSLIVTLKHLDQVRSVQFSADDSKLLTSSLDGYARLWNVSSGDEILGIEHSDGVEFASFAANDRQIITASRDSTGRVWDLQGRPVSPPLRHTSVVKHIAMSPDGTTVATASEDHTARVWDARTGESKTLALRHRGVVNLVRFSPDGHYLLTASDDFSVVIWDGSTGQPTMPTLPHSGEVISAEFTKDGSQLLTASHGRVACLWEIGSTDVKRMQLAHDGGVYHAEFGCKGNLLLTASHDKSARVWNTLTRELVLPRLEHSLPVNHATFNADCSRIATTSGNRERGELRLWDASSGKLIWTLEWADPAERCHFSPDGRHITFAAGQGAMLVDLSRPDVIATFEHDARISSVCFSPDGAQLVTTGYDKQACVWDLATGTLVYQPLPHDNRVDFACYSPDGGSILTTTSGEGERSASTLWDAKTGRPKVGFANHQSWYVLHAAFHPSGDFVCCAGSVSAIMWDTATGRETASTLRHRGMVKQVQFSPDGRLIATASWDNTARVWDAKTGQPVSPPIKHRDWVTSVDFSPDGSYLATASRDGTSRIIDLRTIDGAEEDLVRISELLSAARIDQNGGTARLAVDEFETRWRAMGDKLRSLIQ